MPKVIGDIEELLTAAEHLARSEIQEIKKQAEQEVERIRANANERAEKTRRDILARAREKAAVLRQRRQTSDIRLETDRYLREREALLEQVWQQADDKLHELVEQETQYAEVLARQALAALDILGPGERLIAADARGHELLTPQRLKKWEQTAGKQFEKKVTFERDRQPHGSWGGLIVMDKNRRRRVDATFATRLALAREELREEVFRKLRSS